ncbi:MAG: hypothetical protein V2A70_07085, partial [Candidatus Omnitrophota bacterium]
MFSGLIFAAVFIAGIFCARNKPLWKDEYYSLTASILPLSYGKIISGQHIVEANNSPLFYLVEKAVVDIFSYDVRLLALRAFKDVHFFDFRTWRWQVNRYNVEKGVYGDPFSNIFLRLVPLILMAFIPALFFYYFAGRYSWVWGIYAALLCCSSWMFWWYGLEMRQYIYIYAFT